MKTDSHPMDYEDVKRLIVLDEPVKLCPVDGNYLFAMPGSDGRAVCLFCRGTDYEMVMQSKAADYRASKVVEVPNGQAV